GHLCFCASYVAAAPAIYSLSLHDALPISSAAPTRREGRSRVSSTGPFRASRSRRPSSTSTSARCRGSSRDRSCRPSSRRTTRVRSEEHTSELQSRGHLVCRLLLEKKKNIV